MTNFLMYWKEADIDPKDIKGETPLTYCGSEQLKRVSIGDCVWIISYRKGSFCLLGRITVGLIAGRGYVETLLKKMRPVREVGFHILAEPGSETKLIFRDCDQLLRTLKVKKDGKIQRIVAASEESKLTPMHFMAMRTLTDESAERLAALLD